MMADRKIIAAIIIVAVIAVGGAAAYLSGSVAGDNDEKETNDIATVTEINNGGEDTATVTETNNGGEDMTTVTETNNGGEDTATVTETNNDGDNGGDTENEVHFALVDPKKAATEEWTQTLLNESHNDTTDVVWITGSGKTLLDAWKDAATRNGYAYAIGENPSYPGQLSTINGPFTNYEDWGNTGEGFVWWKTYVCDGSDLNTWDHSLSQTGVVLADHSASEYPYFAFVWGVWETWPNPWGMGSDATVLPSDYQSK
ncbi:predicted protein [Methanosarcina acetivorans C2A]|uniref:Cell surface protein n=2 Tax=Methanosarcina acetivorans TaxID=2214 RepID=Q8TKP9_METAC|nr:predicted protein [Methanosarcina acetivorans C2A]